MDALTVDFAATPLFPGQGISVGGAFRHIGAILHSGLIVLAECGTVVSIGQIDGLLDE